MIPVDPIAAQHPVVQTLQVLFIAAVGACVGSLLNVVVYRLPRGMNLWRPPSACPTCGARLQFGTENLPVFGWLLLRGRCKHCKTRISIRYPLVELFVALGFSLLFVLWFIDLGSKGVDVSWLQPAWTGYGYNLAWPLLLTTLVLLSCLLAMAFIDAETMLIPLCLPWTPLVAAFIVHPLHAAWLGMRVDTPLFELGWLIPSPTSWNGVGLALGGALGLALANILLWREIIPRSFADYEAWEKDAEAEAAKHPKATTSASRIQRDGPADSLLGVFGRVLVLTGPATLGMLLAGFFVSSLSPTSPRTTAAWALVAGVLGLLVGAALRARMGRQGITKDDPAWLAYPHARREMCKELLFLAPVALLAAGGWFAGDLVAGGVPLWLSAFAGSIAGAIAGGAVVWAVRIVGSLAFGVEAMGLGDVHLLAAVGAVAGWIAPLVIFFVAPFLGLGWLVVSRLRGSKGSAMSYGPQLAAATLLVLPAAPLVGTAFRWLSGHSLILW